ncbi:hypothetical protein BH20ACT18_BH20ACT18_09150 [soil metagenome]
MAGSPVDWLTAHRELLAAQPRGPALDVACGLGRHAMMLAGMGFIVDALDVSDTALEAVDAQARRRGRAIHTKRVDLRTDDWRPERAYQIVVDTYFLERSLFGRLADALAPGGLLFFETFMEGQPELNPSYMVAPGELRSAFAQLDVLDAREGRVDSDRVLASLVARKPLREDVAGKRSLPARGIVRSPGASQVLRCAICVSPLRRLFPTA